MRRSQSGFSEHHNQGNVGNSGDSDYGSLQSETSSAISERSTASSQFSVTSNAPENIAGMGKFLFDLKRN